MLRDEFSRFLKDRHEENAVITRPERNDLLRHVKLTEKVSKTGLAEYGAKLLVQLDKQLDTYYSFDSDEIWKRAHEAGMKAIAEAQAIIHARCRELGIPDRFAPQIEAGWRGQGEQAFKERRNELRAIGRRVVDAMIKEGAHKIERASLETQAQIMAITFSKEAKALLDAIPTPEQMMPTLELADMEKKLDIMSGGERYYLTHSRY